MDVLRYQVPASLHSRSMIQVYDQYRHTQFVIERFDRYPVLSFISTFFPARPVHVRVKRDGHVLAEAIDKSGLVGSRQWIVTYEGDSTLELLHQSADESGRRASFQVGNRTFEIESTHEMRESRLMLNGEIIALLTHTKLSLPRENTVEFVHSDLPVPLIICLLHTYDLAQVR